MLMTERLECLKRGDWQHRIGAGSTIIYLAGILVTDAVRIDEMSAIQ